MSRDSDIVGPRRIFYVQYYTMICNFNKNTVLCHAFLATVLSTVALMLQACVCLSVRNVLWLNGAS